MEWGNKFSDLMRETEFNLQKVKDRLSSARTAPALDLDGAALNDKARIYKLINIDNAFPKSATKPYDFPSFSFAAGSLSSALVTPTKPDNNDFPSLHESPNLLSGTQLENSSGAVMVLYERLGNQSDQIQKLYENMKNIEDERDQYQRQVRNLKEELNTIGTRMSEKGVDLVTERKMASWRQEMSQEMQELKSDLNFMRTRYDELSQSSAHFNIQKELQDMRRVLQNECGSIHGEVEALKSRLLTLEVSMGKMTIKKSDLDERQRRLETSVASLQQLKHSSFGASSEKKEISNLRSSIYDIASKLTKIEDTVQQESKAKRSRKVCMSPIKPPSEFMSMGSDLDLMSTIDLSDLSATDLTLSPTHKGRTFTEDFGDATVDTDDLLSVDELTADLI